MGLFPIFEKRSITPGLVKSIERIVITLTVKLSLSVWDRLPLVRHAFTQYGTLRSGFSTSRQESLVEVNQVSRTGRGFPAVSDIAMASKRKVSLFRV